jgi:hypothetical protein
MKFFYIKHYCFKGKKIVIMTPDSKSKSLITNHKIVFFFFSFELNKKIKSLITKS